MTFTAINTKYMYEQNTAQLVQLLLSLQTCPGVGSSPVFLHLPMECWHSKCNYFSSKKMLRKKKIFFLVKIMHCDDNNKKHMFLPLYPQSEISTGSKNSLGSRFDTVTFFFFFGLRFYLTVISGDRATQVSNQKAAVLLICILYSPTWQELTCSYSNRNNPGKKVEPGEIYPQTAGNPSLTQDSFPLHQVLISINNH